MTATLPLTPAPSSVAPFLRDFGGNLVPFLGGPEQRINRIGTRFGLRVTMPPMRVEVARVFIARLLRGRQERLAMEWPQLDLDVGAAATASVASSVSGGSAIPVSGGATFKEGQFFSVVHAGRRYVHMATGDASGAISIFPPLRTPLSGGDKIEIEPAMIEGYVMPGDELSWEMAISHTIGLSFSVVEAA